jgi:hypothetical protein
MTLPVTPRAHAQRMKDTKALSEEPCAFGCGQPAIHQLKNGRKIWHEDMREIFDYVWDHYGRDFVRLYE